MKPKSAQNKGKRFETAINKEIEAMGLGRAIRTPGSGSGKIKGDSFNNLDVLLECKNQKIIHIKKWIDQAKDQAIQGNWDRDKWALIFQDPRTSESNPSIYVTIDLWEFLKLLKKNKDPLIKTPDKNFKWELERLRSAINTVMKRLK